MEYVRREKYSKFFEDISWKLEGYRDTGRLHLPMDEISLCGNTLQPILKLARRFKISKKKEKTRNSRLLLELLKILEITSFDIQNDNGHN